MGAVSSGFVKASHAEGWASMGRGPRLRQIFGAYLSQDVWGVQRRYRQIDDGNGYVSYDDLQKLVGAEEFSLLFLWDIFSQQNELMDIMELMTVICLFSSMRLEEKVKFLLTIFDDSKCSVCTAEEVSRLCAMVLGILARCIGAPAVKVKQVAKSLKQDLPDIVPAFQEAAGLVGVDAAFQTERVIHHSDLAGLLAPIEIAYERLPVSGAPPSDSPPPPPPEWGIIVGGGGGNDGGKSGKPPPKNSSKAKELAMSKPAETEPHLAWMQRLEEESANDAMSPTASAPTSTRSWMLMHTAEFPVVAKDLPSFRQAFVRCTTSSLALPPTCIDLVNVSTGPTGAGSTLAEFLIHPRDPRQDDRSASTLLSLLEQQLASRHSALRKGDLCPYLEEAELLAGEPQRHHPQVTSAARDGAAPATAEFEAQTEPLELLASPWPVRRPAAPRPVGGDGAEEARLREARRTLEMLRRRAEKAEAAQPVLEGKLQQKDAVVAELSAKLEAARQAA